MPRTTTVTVRLNGALGDFVSANVGEKRGLRERQRIHPRSNPAGQRAVANMKELRLSAADGEWRVAFAFDPERRAVLLVAGEKSGRQPEAVLPRSHPQSR